MKDFLILNHFYKFIKQVNEKTFIGLIEGVKDEKEALKKAKTKFQLATVKNVIAEECFPLV